MRRAIARGRIVPQSLSTDPRYGRLSLKAQVLYPLMWVNADDQGRLSGDPDEIKYAACPNVREIVAEEIPALLQQMETKAMIKVYTTSKTKAIQMLDWWDVQRLQWAYPSEYPPPEDWQDSLRYHPTPTEIITENWPPPSRLPSPPASQLPNPPASQLPNPPASQLPNPPASQLPSELQTSPLTTPIEKENEEEREGGRGRGISPSALGSPSPPPVILDKLKICYPYAFGKQPGARILAQLRDLAKELSAAGCPLDYIDQAFSEAAGQNKFSISYVRAILLDWLGVERNRSP